jgi:hypothetical protein
MKGEDRPSKDEAPTRDRQETKIQPELK